MAATVLGCATGMPWVAEAATTPSQPIEDFYGALLHAMRNAQLLKVKGRYGELEPVMLQSFDVPVMTRLAIGSRFDGLEAADRTKLQDAFGKLLVASFAAEFDDFKGETFSIDDQVADRGADKLVKTKFHPSGAPVELNYLVRNKGGTWRIIDVYLNGNISQLATWRSKFGDLLQNGGPQAMLDGLQKQTDRYLATI